jgi:zinc protease
MVTSSSLFATRPAGAAGGLSTATRHVFSHGMVALVQRNSSTPSVSIRGELRIGAVRESSDKCGLATFTAASLIRGTHKRTFQHVVAEMEERGCNVSIGGGMHVTGFSAKALTEDLSLVLDILSDILIHPTFPEREIEKLRGMFLMGLRESEEETQTQVSRATRSLLYPSEHPYSRLSSGTVETVSSLSRDDMVAFHKLYHPSLMTISVVGDVEPDAVIAALERVFGDWSPDMPPPEHPLPFVPPITGIHRHDIPMEGKIQSDILWSVHGLKRSDSDFYAARVGNMILGRLGMGGRLGDNVRDNQGLAYHTFSAIQAGEYAGPWLAGAGVNPTNVERALESILQEICQFAQEGPTEQEMSDAQSYLTGSLVLGLETNDGVAGTLVDIEYYDLGLDYIDRYPDIINNIRREDVTAVAQKYLSTENYVVAVAGP